MNMKGEDGIEGVSWEKPKIRGGYMMAFLNKDTFETSVGTESAAENGQNLDVEEKVLDW